MKPTKTGLTRRHVLAAGAALPLFSILTRRGEAAEFTYKYATGQDPTHPVNKRAQEALDRIREATSGRVEIKLFPANQLGSDTDLLAQVRSGGVEFFNLSTSILATLVPVSGIVNTGFAFPDYATVWKAVDGDLGKYIRTQIEKTGLVAPAKFWDNGFRQITSSTREIRTPQDLNGFKIRVPPAPMLTSVFKSLNAGATPINFNELYSALQTKVVEGQENPLAIIASTRLYEVQKSCSMTGHVWDGYVILGNRRAWGTLPEDVRAVVTRELDKSAVDQRADIASLNQSLRADLTAKGITFIDVDRELFRKALASTPFYGEWKAKYGDEAWGLLEAAVGKLGG
ncbi:MULTISPECIES: TRAP transporter substrate-binding protein [Xanthobacter]|uniref:ABC transporter substrate-binding protein n=1 Tax=Xanthobacter flavus TaxID=281 RepID=A0A9W6CR97_XANFL|nr:MULTISPECIES: TRAP transporter substrate-binding protein [Xanthobacter]MBN8914937.1 TRAP transporter substrate-binding protein [Hyphomicrobiales bacterium]MDR6335524.1 tripartite ATP-independent transporter DctP family solute receptor [Xanthobacter flavus]NMN58850.1 tripartite ATP-independent transporter DctP family solute receptor [Xanthobacter sp. SG618]UDQ87907.1 TRAP transporter substrate-binding protein [Xanthobacter autotrophicus]UJX46214.1 TRAP transporter substrate-binding protein [